MKSELQLLLDVEVGYDLLPAQENLPEQIDVKYISVLTKGKKGKGRKVNVLGALDESALINLEDEILEEIVYDRVS
jgi:hypothetical protein